MSKNISDKLFSPLLSSVNRVVRRTKKLDRNTILIICLVTVLGVVAVWASIFKNNSPADLSSGSKVEEQNESPEVAPLEAKLSFIEGIVEYKDDRGIWSSAVTDTKISKDMGVRTTGASSKAIIKIEDGTIIRLDAGSSIVFESLDRNRVVVFQENGYAYSRVAESSTRNFIFRTTDAQFQAYGTAFRTIASGDEQAIEAYEGAARETTVNKTAEQGQKLVARNAADPSKNNTVEQLDIEKTKQDTFILWNRDLDLKDDNLKKNMGFLADFNGPVITITEPKVDSTIEVAEELTSGTVRIKGTTEAGTKLSVRSKSAVGSEPKNVPVLENGSFESDELSAPIGTSVFEFTAIDKAGNKTVTNITYTFKNKVTIQEQTITLTADNSDKEKISVGWTLTGLATPDGTKLLAGTTKNLTIKDHALKTISDGVTTFSIDTDEFDKEGTYYLMVCRYSQATADCDVKSNVVSVTIKK